MNSPHWIFLNALLSRKRGTLYFTLEYKCPVTIELYVRSLLENIGTVPLHLTLKLEAQGVMEV